MSLLQPVLPPLHDTLSDGDALLRLLGKVSGMGAPGSYEELLHAAWGKRLGEAGRNRLLEKGYAEETLPKKAVSLDGKAAAKTLRGGEAGEDTGKPVLVLTPSLRTFDGRSRILPILSEIPDPLTTITYGPWISMSEEDAARAGLRDRDEVTVTSADWQTALPVKIQPGLAAGVFFAYRDLLPSPPIRTDRRTGGGVEYIEGVRISRTGKTAEVPILSGSFSQMGRGLIPDPAHLEEGRRQGCMTLAITNAPDSPLAQAADHVLDIQAGPELAVAATKTYTCELMAIAMLSAALDPAQFGWDFLAKVPSWVKQALEHDAAMAEVVQRYKYARQCVVLGRGYEYATARELALKIQELAQIMAHAWSSADFEHGPLVMHQGLSRKTHLSAWIDCHSRYLVEARVGLECKPNAASTIS